MDTPTPDPSEGPIQTVPAEDDPANSRILVVDDQFAIRSLFEEVLNANSFEVRTARQLSEAEAMIQSTDFAAIVLDIFLSPEESGLMLIPLIRRVQPHTPVIIISGMASMDNVMEALKSGAYDMLTKPFNIIDMLHVINRAVEKYRMAQENTRLLEALRRERDLLEERVQAATHDLRDTVKMLRLVNEQVGTMFEMSQSPMPMGPASNLISRLFELLQRMIVFDEAFIVVYDIRAQEINLTYADGDRAKAVLEKMTGLFRSAGIRLASVADSEQHLPVERLQNEIWGQYAGGEQPPQNITLMPLHVHQTLIGAVGLAHPEGVHTLSTADERILGLAISHLLAAIEQRNFIARTGQLAGLGELISEIAHDLRNPMTSLRGASRMLFDGWSDEAKRVRCLSEIGSNLSRMESLVSELVNFYNPREMNMVELDINALLDKALRVSSGIIEGRGVSVVRRFAESNPSVLGLTRNLIEAFINLISNACQAMESGGTLTVQTFAELPHDHVERLKMHGHLTGSYMMVSVGDTGCGIPQENLDRIFRRFFTTKPDGHGLGLSAVKRILKKNLGHLHLESEVGRGTTFYIYLPVA